MKISTANGEFDLSAEFTIQIDEKSPITNDIGSQSVPVTIPCTPKNARLTGHAQRMDLGEKTMNGDSSCVIQDGMYVRKGTVNIVSASKKEGITLNIGFDNSEAYSKWKATTLDKLTVCPDREFESVTALANYMKQVFQGEVSTDFAVFPLMITNPSVTENDTTTYYPVILNKTDPQEWGRLMTEARSETTVINGKALPTSLPEGYGLTGFLYVGYVLELIFKEFGYELTENPFTENAELAHLVVLNNAADACTTPTLHYLDLMPTCTVEDFLKSLYARFGAVYSISTDTRKAKMRLIRDIIQDQPNADYTDKMEDLPLITYAEPRQLRLSAKTSIQGAAPETERYEDFVKNGKSYPFYKDSSFTWQYLMVERWTGRWFRYDKDNREAKEVGSSFFVWDRKEKGMEYEDIASEDESVPMIVSSSYRYPAYLTGIVHRYTDVHVSDDDAQEEEKGNTPLAFLLAFSRTNAPYAFGSSFPWDEYGNERMEIDGVPFSFQLTWQFEDGLFRKFWQDYDAILRHANNQIDVDMLLNIGELQKVDFLKPATINGQRLLIDSLSYSLPARKFARAAMVFRTLRLIGPYNQESEYQITRIRYLNEILVWRISSRIYPDSIQYRQQLIQEADDPEYNLALEAMDYGYFHWETDNRKYLTEGYLTPEEDMESFADPDTEGEQLARTYNCLEDVDLVGWYRPDPETWHEDGPEDETIEKIYIRAHAEREVEYTTNFIARPFNAAWD